MQTNSGNLFECLAYLAWTRRIDIFGFWMAIKNLRWQTDPVSLRGGLGPLENVIVLVQSNREKNKPSLAYKKRKVKY